MLGGADNPNGELPSYITGANRGGIRRNTVWPQESFSTHILPSRSPVMISTCTTSYHVVVFLTLFMLPDTV